jgi:nucleoside-diphosphate-sugar epimerase
LNLEGRFRIVVGMNIFVTGASGFVGSAVVRELLGAGHRVVGLVRSEAGVAELSRLGAAPLRGTLEDLALLTGAAARADAVIHTAFNHDFSRFAASCEEDRRVIGALGAPLVGTTRPLVVTSALGVLPSGELSTEETAPVAGEAAHPRSASERAAGSLAERGVRVAVVRLPPSTHGQGDPHFVANLIRIARAKGESAYLDDGENRWPAVHRLDAARVFRLAAEHARAGARYHAVAEEGVTLRSLATAIGQRLAVPVVSKPQHEAVQHFGGFARFVALDVPSSSGRTRSELAWEPCQPGLLEDLEHGRYFE